MAFTNSVLKAMLSTNVATAIKEHGVLDLHKKRSRRMGGANEYIKATNENEKNGFPNVSAN